MEVGDIVSLNPGHDYKYNGIDRSTEIEVQELIDGGRLFKGKIVSNNRRFGSEVGYVTKYTSERFHVKVPAPMSDVILSERRLILDGTKVVRTTTVDMLDSVLAGLHKMDHSKKYVVYKPEFESFVEAPPVMRKPIE